MSAHGTNLANAPEIEYMIAKVLIKDFELLRKYKWHTQETAKEQDTILCTLLALRLTCKHLEKAQIIKACVFKEVAFIASFSQLERLRFPRESALVSIAPFVRKVKFLPSPFNLDLDPVFFAQLTNGLLEHLPDLPLRSKRHVDTYWGGVIPVSHPDIMECWGDYQEKAQDDHNYLLSGVLQSLWTAGLFLLTQANHFELASMHGRHPLVPSYDIEGPDVCKTCTGCRCRLNDLSQLGNYELFRTAIQCLAPLQHFRPIQSLSISSELAAAVPEWRDMLWVDLDVGQVRSLSLPSCAYWDEEFDRLARGQAIENALVQVLQKPFPALQRLEIAHSVAIPLVQWPPQQHPTFPSLRLLQLHGLQLRLWPLAAIMASSPALKTIIISDCTPHTNNAMTDGWRLLYDALRMHQNAYNMHLIFNEVWHKFEMLSFIFGRSTFDPNAQNLSPDYRKLFMYLAGLGQWDNTLHQWFEML
ncbi:hypothetical protein H2200_006002 [Cladophialophora chaetospira]|uniref:Uncharacterized protein n=1 Tax=Cladophialophora chaetospira TaxID=386627 RepID=A0AA39CIP9_9EURO|nr:hypothetical protein H2200_006002 [Cladophialophora chaetospira]